MHARRREIAASDARIGKLLVALLFLYGVASLVHFTHNAEFLREYPNMPSGLSRWQIYIAWVAVTAIGIGGCVLWSRGHAILGLCVIAAYAALGFDGLAHYALAPFAAHSALMHLTIWLEVVAAAGLFAAALGRMAKLAFPKGRNS